MYILTYGLWKLVQVIINLRLGSVQKEDIDRLKKIVYPTKRCGLNKRCCQLCKCKFYLKIPLPFKKVTTKICNQGKQFSGFHVKVSNFSYQGYM